MSILEKLKSIPPLLNFLVTIAGVIIGSVGLILAYQSLSLSHEHQAWIREQAEKRAQLRVMIHANGEVSYDGIQNNILIEGNISNVGSSPAIPSSYAIYIQNGEGENATPIISEIEATQRIVGIAETTPLRIVARFDLLPHMTLISELHFVITYDDGDPQEEDLLIALVDVDENGLITGYTSGA